MPTPHSTATNAMTDKDGKHDQCSHGHRKLLEYEAVIRTAGMRPCYARDCSTLATRSVASG